MTEAAETEAGQRLRAMRALTDVTLSRLGPERLLDELLERVRSVLSADTAVILVPDPHSRQLVVTAAKGLEEEVRRRIRVPFGLGFAGRVAATGEIVAVEELTPADVVSPVLLDVGLRSVVGVPIYTGGELVGVLHAGSRQPRRFSANDRHLLELVADRVGAATARHAAGVGRDAALALQRSLLPTRLPPVPGLDLAARYVPGHEAGVGGDWYDVFPLPGDRLGVVIGDVSGHGLGAAVVMGRLRSALRAYALTSDDPAAVVELLDRKVHHFEAGKFATVAYAVVDPGRGEIRLSLAGHFPPLLGVPDGPARPVEAPVDPPLGLWGSRPVRHTTTVALPRGRVLVWYTDGLVERRDEVIDEGIARLAAAVRPGPAEEVCATIMALLGMEQPADDIAILSMYRPAEG